MSFAPRIPCTRFRTLRTRSFAISSASFFDVVRKDESRLLRLPSPTLPKNLITARAFLVGWDTLF